MKKQPLLFFLVLILSIIDSTGQQTEIKGTVTSAGDGSPLPGVNVTIKGASVGTQTDFDGKYTITASPQNTLIFSYVGMKTKEIPITNSLTINVQLEEDTEELGAVVVIGYGQQVSSKKLGYAVSTIQGDEINAVRTVNVTNSLSGRAAGVQINQNGTGAGGSSSIVIRGNSSLSPNNQALIVIDGVIVDNGGLGQGGFDGGIDYGNALSEINAEEIASISVLKGGNATALYGYRGANGVVVITTKKGQSESLRVDFSSAATFNSVLVAPKFQNQYGQGRFDTGSNELLYDIETGTSWGPLLDGGQRTRFDGIGTAAYTSEGNSFKDFYNTGTTLVNSIAISQRLDKGSYRFSYENLNNNSILPGSTIKRHNLTMNATFNASDRFHISGKINYIRNNSVNRPDLTDGQANTVKNLALRPRNISNALLRTNYLSEDGTPNNWNGQFIMNPYYATLTKLNQDTKDRYLGLVKLDYKFTENLEVSARISQDQSVTKAQIFQPEGAFDLRSSGGFIDIVSEAKVINYDALLNYNPNISDSFTLTTTLGASQNRLFSKTLRAVGEDILVPGFFAIDNFSNKNVSTLISESRANSLFGSITFGYNNYLYLELTGRNDWSSTLPIENASFFYPSVGGSFILTEALQMNSNILNFLKLRASYAKVGNATEPYRLLNTYNISTNTYNGQSFFYYGAALQGGAAEEGAAPGISLANPNLKAELSTTYEAGIDMGLFDDRIKMNLTYYNIETRNQILSLSLPPSYGAESRFINAGLLKNSGVEISLTTKPISSKDFSWESTINYTKNTSEIERLTEGVTTQVLAKQFNEVIQLVATEGNPVGDLVGTTFARDDAGNLIYDSDGLPVIGEQGVIGNTTPDFLLGWQNTFNYKNLSLGILLDGRFGGEIFSFSDISLTSEGTDQRTLAGREYFTGGTGILVPQNAVIDGSLSPEILERGVDPQTYWGRLEQISEQWVYDASFIKLREISLSYRFNKKVISALRLSNLSIGYIGRNVAILHKETPNFDPENGFNTSIGGIEFFGFPSTANHGFKLSVSF